MSSRPGPPRRRRPTQLGRTALPTGPVPGRAGSSPAARRAAGLTTRAAVLALLVCALVVSAALPLREYLSQRAGIARVEAAQGQQQARVAALERQLLQLHDPAYLRSQARLRLHFVLPGETAYLLLDPTKDPAATGSGTARGTTATGPGAPWYSQLWGSVAAADRPLRPAHRTR